MTYAWSGQTVDSGEKLSIGNKPFNGCSALKIITITGAADSYTGTKPECQGIIDNDALWDSLPDNADYTLLKEPDS